VSTEDNKALVRRYFEAGDRDDLSAWDQICSPDMVLNPGFGEPIRGLDAVKAFTAGFHSAFSHLFLTVHDLIAEDDRVAARWTAGGTHTAPLGSPGGPIPPTGKQMAMQGISIVRLAHGKIVEERVQPDMLGAMQQLGVIPTPEQATT
jgi:ketosteroid isomerase-like protein